MVRSANVTSRVKTTLRFACVYCAGKRALEGYRSLADSPKLLQTRWHPIRNGDLTPGNVAAASNRNVWWICSVGHEFDQPVSTVFRMDNCPVCLNYRIYPGVNDLLTVSPSVAANGIRHGTATSPRRKWELAQQRSSGGGATAATSASRGQSKEDAGMSRVLGRALRTEHTEGGPSGPRQGMASDPQR